LKNRCQGNSTQQQLLNTVYINTKGDYDDDDDDE